MKLSETIQKLATHLKNNGDLDVKLYGRDDDIVDMYDIYYIKKTHAKRKTERDFILIV